MWNIIAEEQEQLGEIVLKLEQAILSTSLLVAVP